MIEGDSFKQGEAALNLVFVVGVLWIFLKGWIDTAEGCILCFLLGYLRGCGE